MRLATIRTERADGRVVVVSPDGDWAVPIEGADSLLDLLGRWGDFEALLKELERAVGVGRAVGSFRLDAANIVAPLPRTWQWLDGSAFMTHGMLMAKAYDVAPLSRDRPLMYQGLSDRFFGWNQDIPFPSERDGIDFEGEFGVIVDEVPMGVTPIEAERHIRLIIQVNDWSLRVPGAAEMRTGFGWVQAKPACSVAPFAVTPGELGAAWSGGKVSLDLSVAVNGRRFGEPCGAEMAFSFPELIAHAAYSRALPAGTIIGSGTVSNADYHRVGSACISERRAIELIESGASTTPFLRFGDVVRMEARAQDGRVLFGAIEQRIKRAGS